METLAPEKQLYAALQAFAREHGASLSTVYCDALELTATSLNGSTDPGRKEEHDARHKVMAESMGSEKYTQFTELSAKLMACIRLNEKSPIDVLGNLWRRFGLEDGKGGQVFTPLHSAGLMAELAGEVPLEQQIPPQGYISVIDPACGSGMLGIGFLNRCVDEGFDFRCKALYLGTDIDIRCVWMAYIQMFWYGLPAIITHGDFMEGKTWSTWVTPYCVNLPGW